MASGLLAKIAIVGRSPMEFALPEGATIADLVNAGRSEGLNLEGYAFRVRGSTATPETPLQDGDVVWAGSEVKGG